MAVSRRVPLRRLSAAHRTLEAMRDLGLMVQVDTSLCEQFLAVSRDLDLLDREHRNYPQLVAVHMRLENRIADRMRGGDGDEARDEEIADLLT